MVGVETARWKLSEPGLTHHGKQRRDLPPTGAAPRRHRRVPQRGFVSARAVGSFVPKLTHKAFEKYGFSAATLITDWAMIVGEDVAGYTAPERLKWPRGVGIRDDVEQGAEGRPGATLVLRVEPARALDVQYKARQLIERINAYFGYRAVAELRLVQAPLPERAVAWRLCAATPPPGRRAGARRHRRRAAARRAGQPRSGADEPRPGALSGPEIWPSISFIHLERQPFCLISTLSRVLLGRQWPGGRRTSMPQTARSAPVSASKTPSGRFELSRRVVLAVLAAGAIGAGVAMLTRPPPRRRRRPSEVPVEELMKPGAAARSRARHRRTPRSPSSNTPR